MENVARKKILFVITKSNWGGAQRYVYELATSLPSDQYEVAVALGGTGYAGAAAGALEERLAAADVRTIAIKNFQRDLGVLADWRALCELRALYRRERPDLVHLNSSKAVLLGALGARVSRVPHIVSTVHGWAFFEPRPLWWRALVWVGSWLGAVLSHTIILVSAHDRHAWMPLTRRKSRVIRTAVPPISFKTRDEARTALYEEATIAAHADDIWLTTIAELTPNKNLFAAVDAVAAHNRSGTSRLFYTIIGDGEQKAALAAHIAAQKAESYVHLAGSVTDARTYLKAFDLFLLPSQKEGLPYALLEAGAAELAVIASNVGGIPEVIEHGKNGLLIDPNDHSTITEALADLAADPEKRTRFAASLTQKVHREFAFSRLLTETVAAYRSRQLY